MRAFQEKLTSKAALLVACFMAAGCVYKPAPPVYQNSMLRTEACAAKQIQLRFAVLGGRTINQTCDYQITL